MAKVERSDYVLGAEILSLCHKKSYRIIDLTKELYGNYHSKNMVRVYMCLEALMKHGVIVPEFRNNFLRFKYNNGV